MAVEPRTMVTWGAGIALTMVLLPFGVGAASPPPLPPLPPGVHNPACVRVIREGDSLTIIVDELALPGVDVTSLVVENGVADPDAIDAGDLLDYCIDGVDDVTGEARDAPGDAVADPAGLDGVEAQQARLNQLFAGLGMPELLVDGVSGPLTRQQLCAARLLLDLPVSRADMAPGSAEEQMLMSSPGLRIPRTAVTDADRWIVIDLTCQILIAGEGTSTVRFAFPTSTGVAGAETRLQERAWAFRYDPALDNDGWHDSSLFPVAADNPLNGNMYRPIYFDRGQAIHGSGNVPPEPRSKGCARLHVEDQDALVAWLGLGDATGPVWSTDRINLVVTVQGQYQPAA